MALEQGLIGPVTFKEIDNAYRWKQEPPVYTTLGGYLGIHGLGAGDIEVHRSYNWTNGCIRPHQRADRQHRPLARSRHPGGGAVRLPHCPQTG